MRPSHSPSYHPPTHPPPWSRATVCPSPGPAGCAACSSPSASLPTPDPNPSGLGGGGSGASSAWPSLSHTVREHSLPPLLTPSNCFPIPLNQAGQGRGSPLLHPSLQPHGTCRGPGVLRTPPATTSQCFHVSKSAFLSPSSVPASGAGVGEAVGTALVTAEEI